MESKKFYSEIYNRYGNIKRARGNFLYTQKNIRLTDLYREEGRAILGWHSNAYTVLKNTLSKGLAGSFTTASRGRLEKAVCELLNSKRKIFVYSTKQSALQASLLISKESTSVYKPLAKNADKSALDFSKTKSVVLYPPLAWTKNIFIVAALCDASTNPNLLEEELRIANLAPEFIPPALEAAAARSIYDLLAAQKTLQEKDFFIYDSVLTKYWRRTGCYLQPKVPQEKYDAFILHCLDLGIVISPEYNIDSIVPFGADAGIFRTLKNSPFEF